MTFRVYRVKRIGRKRHVYEVRDGEWTIWNPKPFRSYFTTRKVAQEACDKANSKVGNRWPY